MGDFPDLIMGEVERAILADQFSRLQEGARPFFKNNADDVNDDLQVSTRWNETELETTDNCLDDLPLALGQKREFDLEGFQLPEIRMNTRQHWVVSLRSSSRTVISVS
jgi:hypothetical protein